MEDDHLHEVNKESIPKCQSEEKEEAERIEGRHDEEDDTDEALSFSDLPLNNNATNKCKSSEDTSSKQSRRSSFSEATDFFEFFSDVGSNMVPADDIIFCGKLIPSKDNSPPSDQIHKNSLKENNKPPIHRRRSESLSKLQSSVTRSNSATTPNSSGSRRLMMRGSRSLDYQRLYRSSSSVTSTSSEVDRSSPERSAVMSEMMSKKALKPRWYSMVFGIAKVPTEMELNDIKNRQIRRSPSTTMFPATDSDGKVTVNRCAGKVSWKILRALSCKDHTSVAVTTSLPVPQAS